MGAQTDAASFTLSQDYLRTLLGSRVWVHGERLPSVRAMARSAHVAATQMVRAVACLAELGTLTVIPRSGVYYGRLSRGPWSARVPLWQGVSHRLERDVLDERFGVQGRLPPTAELCRRYSVAYQTMRKALRRVCDTGLLVRRRGTLERARVSIGTAGSTVWFLGPGYPTGQHYMVNDRHVECLRAIESACAQSGLRFRHRGLVPGRGLGSCVREAGPVIGYVLWSHGVDPQMLTQSVVPALCRTRKPIAIIDEMADDTLLASLGRLPGLRIFAPPTINAGRQVATLLRENGHKRAAFFSAAHTEPWSRLRYRGICTVFGSETDSSTVALLTPQSTSGSANRFARSLASLASLSRAIEESDLLPSVRTTHDVRIARMTVSELLRFYRQFAQLNPLFEAVWARHQASAWICANDHTAFMALEFLRERGAQIGKDVSVSGFDNTPLALHYELTSYDFRFAAIALQSLSYVLYPSSEQFSNKGVRIECPGVTVERASTGRHRSLPAKAPGTRGAGQPELCKRFHCEARK